MNTLTYWLCFPALLVVLVTCVALLNDLTRQHWAPRWHVRRLALALAGSGAGMLLIAPFSLWSPHWLTIALFALLWGLAVALLTHPGMPPWTELLGLVRSRTRAIRRSVGVVESQTLPDGSVIETFDPPLHDGLCLRSFDGQDLGAEGA